MAAQSLQACQRARQYVFHLQLEPATGPEAPSALKPPGWPEKLMSGKRLGDGYPCLTVSA